MVNSVVVLAAGWVAFVALGWLAVDRNAERMEKGLQQAADAAVRDAGLNWARVTVDGQIAEISGLAPTNESRTLAGAVVISAAGPGGRLFGGIVRIRDHSELPEPAQPPVRQVVQMEGKGQQANGATGAAAVPRPQAETGDPAGRGTSSVPAEPARSTPAQGQPRPPSAPLPPAAVVAAVPVPTAPPRPEAAPARTLLECRRAVDAVTKNLVIRFTAGSLVIEPASEGPLQRLARVAREKCSGARLRIGGHTDNRGREQFNLELSFDRAAAVRDLLVKAGLPTERLEVVGYGSGRPIAENETEEGRTRNRRITFETLEE
jgi:outer membrane protein OmpA-like peptidoglycan-associated protein